MPISTRRGFLKQVGAAASVAAVPGLARRVLATGDDAESARVVIARDEALTKGRVGEHAALLKKLVDAAVQKLTDSADPASAWKNMFQPEQRVGIKINGLGHPTQPAVVDAIVAGLREMGTPAENIIIWDRFDSELEQAGFKINKSTTGVKCYGTDTERYGSGYMRRVESSGRIGSCFSKIIAEQVDVLISVPVLKDHSLAGASLGMKNFYGAIHNPNKYHDNNCDPYIVDIVSHPYVGPRWKLTVCDGTRAQYNGGPGIRPNFAWAYGGLIISRDIVAADAVAADLLEQQRRAKGLKSLADSGRPAKYLATAANKGLGVADLNRIQRLEV